MKIGCVVVLYKPDLKVVKNIASYPKNLDNIILVDNSENNNDFLFKNILGESITYRRLGRNTGISHALNEGIKLAMPYVDFIITMDQDSLLTEDIINVYKKFINNFSGKVPYALTPKYNTDRHTEKRGTGYEYVNLSMQSGTLFSKKIFSEIGFFDESLFIDVVDWEFFLRMSKNGCKLIRCNEAVLNHNPAKTKSKRFLLFTLRYGVASPTRYYYQARNLLIVARKYKNPRLYLTVFIKYLKIVLLFDNKVEYLRYFKRGLRDARTGRK